MGGMRVVYCVARDASGAIPAVVSCEWNVILAQDNEKSGVSAVGDIPVWIPDRCTRHRTPVTQNSKQDPTGELALCTGLRDDDVGYGE